MPARSPSRNDGVTNSCPCCGRDFTPTGRRRFCSHACRQAAWRQRHHPPTPTEIPPPRPRQPRTVYACPTCDARYLGQQHCPDCNTFCRRIGSDGTCPCCDEPITHDELLNS
jgi:hypothetical protein